MTNKPLTLHSFPHAILHIDGDAFFASCEQSRNPALAGKPVITGKERGIASSMSYEAKAKGVKRGMVMADIKKNCPDAIFIPSDYETYSLLSKRFFSIVRRYTPDVEEYSIDECFAEITGLQRPLGMSYERIAEKIKAELDKELGFTFSAGLAPNKVVAKIGSKWKKPSGLTIIPGNKIHEFIKDLPPEKIWGIGPQTSAYLERLGIKDTLQFALRSEEWIKQKFTKPHCEIWAELNGRYMMPLDTSPKSRYYSIQKMKTFTPASNDKAYVFSQLSRNIENACIKARRYNLSVKSFTIFLKDSFFETRGIEVKLSLPCAVPEKMLKVATEAFDLLFDKRNKYRATGVVLLKLDEAKIDQLDLFGEILKIEEYKQLYGTVDSVREKYGKHAVYLGSSHLAHKMRQHEGERAEVPLRKGNLFLGETKRKRIGIPMFMGEVR